MSPHLIMRIVIQIIATAVLGFTWYTSVWDLHKIPWFGKKWLIFGTVVLGFGLSVLTLFNWCVKFTINGVIG